MSKNSPFPFSDDNTRFSLGLTALFFILGFIGLSHHEMWRDEWRAWLIAGKSDSIGEVLRILRYEGQPCLWHLFLFPLTRITDNPLVMQLAHLTLAALAVYFLARFAPFKKIKKILICFGYFFFYEYALISRYYVLTVLFAILFCVLYKSRCKTFLWLSMVLSILANTGAYGTMIAMAMAMALITDCCLNQDLKHSLTARKLEFAASLLILALGLALAIYQIIPAQDHSNPLAWKTAFDIKKRLGSTFSILWRSYVPIPDFSTHHFWNTNILMTRGTLKTIGQIFSLGILIFSLGLFAQKIAAFVLYAAGTFMILGFTYFVHFGYIRHWGSLFILFIACLWISDCHSQNKKPFLIPGSLSRFSSKYKKAFLSIIFSSQVIAGLYTYGMDLIYPFSANKETAYFLKTNELTRLPMAGSIDYAMTPISGVLDKPILHLESNRTAYFEVWDSARKEMNLEELANKVHELASSANSNFLLILNHRPKYEPLYITQVVSKKFSIKEAGRFTDSIVADEKYFIYLIERQ